MSMTVFVLQTSTPQLDGMLQNFSLKVAKNVFATCANGKVIGEIQNLLSEYNVKYAIVYKSKQSIIPNMSIF